MSKSIDQVIMQLSGMVKEKLQPRAFTVLSYEILWDI
jgi:hypothetical protein